MCSSGGMMSLFRIAILSGVFFVFVRAEASKKFTVMTFNVENLFDIKDDPNKNDETFLPLSFKKNIRHKRQCQKIQVKKWRDQCLLWDWSEATLKIKLKRLAQVIRESAPGGADLILFQEVENKSVLNRLRREYLSSLGYGEPILIEGADVRGIDVAMMSKHSLKEKPQLLNIPFKGISEKRRGDTRGILKATFVMPDQTLLTAFSVHFPAPFHPARFREQAFDFLNAQLKEVPRHHAVVAGGDFNIPSQEDRERKLLKKYAEPFWSVSHKVGCRKCRGTNYYAPKKSWSFLDMILVSKKSQSKWKLDFKSVRIHNKSSEQTSSKGHPKAFSMPKAQGVSDHWPVLLTLKKGP